MFNMVSPKKLKRLILKRQQKGTQHHRRKIQYRNYKGNNAQRIERITITKESRLEKYKARNGKGKGK